MRNPYTSFLNENIIFRQFLKDDAIDLTRAGFNFGITILRKPVYERIFQAIGFEPRKIGLVAYHIQEKRAIGFLSLVEHTPWLYSIKFVFTDPNFRKMGIANGLLNFALSEAKKRGASKVFLNVDPSKDFVINLYTKLGFRIMVKSFEVWAHADVLKYPIQHESRLTALNLNSGKDKNLLLAICKRCMGNEWTDFFEINSNSLINGFSQDFRRFFFRSAFINDSADSFAMIFSRPLFDIAFLEIFTSSDSAIPSMLEGLVRILRSKGIVYARMKLFNVNDNVTVNLLKQKEQYPYDSLSMGTSL